MKKILVFCLLLLAVRQANAAINGISHHSRANCVGFNESVSWDWTHNWLFWVNSEHLDERSGALIHTIVSGWQTTWRNAAYHFPEGRSGWTVHGFHWMMYSNGQPFLAAEEYVDDCSIYDGWWDRNK